MKRQPVPSLSRCFTFWIGILLLSGCATHVARQRPLYAVLSAYGPETKANEAALVLPGHRVTITRIHGTEFKRVEFEGHDLLLFPSGVSMVNAAMTVQVALDHFPITHVLFAGIAGSMNPAHAIGDVVIPERWYHHSEGAYLNPKRDGSGYVLPQFFKPPNENFGYFFPDHVWAQREGMGKPERQEFFGVDPDLLAAARRAAPRFPTLKLRYESRDCTVSVGGNGISGPVFMDNREYRKWAFRVWKAECLDMESTAVAQVCWVNHKPCLVVRSLSDLAGGQEGVNAEDFTEDVVSRHASEVLREIIRDLPR